MKYYHRVRAHDRPASRTGGLRRKYEITAAGRDVSKFDTSNEKLHVMRVNVLDPASVEAAVSGS